MKYLLAYRRNTFLLALFFHLMVLAFATRAGATVCVNSTSYSKMFGTSWRFDVLRRGHDLAIEEEGFKDIGYFAGQTDAELVREIERSVKDNCNVIVGLYTSRECLLAGPIAKKNNVTILSPTCGHEDIRRFSPSIFTAVPSISLYSKKVGEFARKAGQGKIVVFHQKTDVFSALAFSEFKKEVGSPFVAVDLDREGSFVSNSVPQLKKDTEYLFVFFTYPVPTMKALFQLDHAQLLSKRVSIVGSSSWAFDNSIFKENKGVVTQVQKILVPDIIAHSKERTSTFYRNYKSRYRDKPLVIQWLSYDATKLAIKCYRKAKGTRFNAELFTGCLTGTSHPNGGEQIQFTADSPFAVRPIFFTNLLERL